MKGKRIASRFYGRLFALATWFIGQISEGSYPKARNTQ